MAHYVCFTGVHGVMEAQRDPRLIDIHNRAGMVLPDGMPMVWAGRIAGLAETKRVCGPDFLPYLSERAAKRGWKMFLYGGADGVPDLLAEKLIERFPGLQIVGTYSPPFRELSDVEHSDIADRINATEADLVWVGLPTPKQEHWMARQRPHLDAAALLGVGGAFDMHAGLIERAPEWLQPTGFEWAYRLVKEPGRLWRRYLVNNPRFVWSVARRRPRVVSRS